MLEKIRDERQLKALTGLTREKFAALAEAFSATFEAEKVRAYEQGDKQRRPGAGQKGKKQFQAPLADPYATPNLDLEPEVDALLRGVAQGLLMVSTRSLTSTGVWVRPHESDSVRPSTKSPATCSLRCLSQQSESASYANRFSTKHTAGCLHV